MEKQKEYYSNIKSSFLKRSIAYLIDILLVSFITGILLFGIFIFLQIDLIGFYQSLISDLGTITINNNILLIIIIVEYIIMILYYSIMQYFLKGRTIGKIIFKIRVINIKEKDGRISIFKFFVRDVIIKPIEFLQLVSLFLVFFSKKSLAVHDRIVSTIVVDDKKIKQFNVLEKEEDNTITYEVILDV